MLAIMAGRIILPSRVPCELPKTVEAFIASETNRYEQVLEGTIPDTDGVMDVIDSEYDRLEGEGVEPAFVDGEALDIAAISTIILRGMGRHVLGIQSGAIPTAPEDQERHVASGLLYAGIIKAGLHTMYWRSAIWNPSRAAKRDFVLPPMTHRICETIATNLSERLGGTPNAVSLANRLRFDAESLALTSGQAVSLL